jgi:ATP-dependent Zn protease
MANEHVATQREHSAVHEAGHAVIGRVLGIPCGHATILVDEGSAGHSLAAPRMRPWNAGGITWGGTTVKRQQHFMHAL